MRLKKKKKVVTYSILCRNITVEGNTTDTGSSQVESRTSLSFYPSLGAHSVQLYEELGLDAAASLVLAGTTHAEHRVHLVDEDDRRLEHTPRSTDASF